MVKLEKFEIGSTNTIQKRVTEADAALSYGNGKIEKLFATPSLVGLMLEACYTLVDEKLPEGLITVSKSAKVDHVMPTILGSTVTVNVEVIEASKTFIKFKMKAYDEVGLIGYGEHVRAVVNKNNLLERAQERIYSME